VGLIKSSGEEITPLIYDSAIDFKNGFTLMNLNEKWGIINMLGETIVPYKYDEVFDLGDGIAKFRLGNKWG